MDKKKPVKRILIIITISSVCLAMLPGILVFSISTNLTIFSETSDTKEFSGDNKIEKLSIPSTFDGHDIPFDYIYADWISSTDNKTMILVHGLGGNRYSVYSKAKFFVKQGYNVIAYDQRGSGENKAKHTTFGYYEREDLADLVDYIRLLTDKDIGLLGTSFGGATVGLALGIDSVEENVAFAILDCPLSNIKDELRYQLKRSIIPLPASYIIFTGNTLNKMVMGFKYKDADVRDVVKDTDVPILVINSKADQTTPYPMGTDIYDAIKGEKKDIMTVEDAKHSKVWKKYKSEYKQKVKDFIRKYT